MTLTAVVGQAQALEGREASAQATHRALEQLGRRPRSRVTTSPGDGVTLGLVIASHHYPIQTVVNSVSALLADAPLFGFSTSAELTSTGQSQRSVSVALISASDVTARADWWPGYGEDSRAVAQKIGQALQLYQSKGVLLLAADGLSGDARQLCASLPEGEFTLAGCLAGGDLRRAQTLQIGGRQSGSGGVAGVLLKNETPGALAVGVGLDHGWQPVGAYFHVTRAGGAWIRELDHQPAAETYARLFGYTAREWAFPPLNELARLYPLELEDSRGSWTLRSPLRVESDGSLRLNTSVPEGSIGHLMVSSASGCIRAAEMATRQALANLGNAQPVLALVLADVAWQMQLEAQPGAEVNAIRSILGRNVPIIGGYTYGQIARHPISATPEIFNQHIEVVLFGRPNE